MTAHPTLPPTIRFRETGEVIAAGPGFRPVAVERGSDGVSRALAQCNELSARIRAQNEKPVTPATDFSTFRL